jgi:hypothetical protein
VVLNFDILLPKSYFIVYQHITSSIIGVIESDFFSGKMVAFLESDTL